MASLFLDNAANPAMAQPIPSVRKPSVAILCDYVEERWASMDLVGEMLARELARNSADFCGHRIVPTWKKAASGIAGLHNSRTAFNADRLLNRFWQYPRQLRQVAQKYDLFHIVDHSYAHLVHELPPARTVVYCHDLDAFEAVLEPRETHKLTLRTWMARRTLTGLQKAASVVCSSLATYRELSERRLTSADRTHMVALGVHPAYCAEPNAAFDAEAARLLGDLHEPVLLHVGSNIPRKRIDVLLRVFAALRLRYPAATLVRAGGPFLADQARLAAELKIDRHIIHLPFLTTDLLAAVYRRATLVLVTSESEGFGLPVIESLACGTPVVASGIAPLREAGGTSTTYAGVGDIEDWTAHVTQLLAEKERDSDAWHRRICKAVEQARTFSWQQHASRMSDLYSQILTTSKDFR